MSSDAWGDLTNSLTAVCDQFSQDRQIYEGFLTGSPAALEVVGEPYADDWGPRPSRNANMAGLLLTLVAVDHLACLAALLRPQSRVIYGPSAEARSAMEVAARGYHLLDPEITPLERICRQQNERLVSLSEGKRLAVLLKQPQESINVLDNRTKAIFDSARNHGLTPHPKANPHPYIGSKPPSATKLIDEAVGQPKGLGETYYKVMSAVAHGREHGITQYFTYQGALLDPTHADAFGSIETTPKMTAQYLSGTPRAMANILDRLYDRFGWPGAAIQPALTRMRATWDRIATST
ncbi:hypothetical protein GCM10022403_033840 [Streptomyces coacervatus]|uniref:Uncharacterized protein n=1 Tax=Streptomyces coacervatus TaxID=647381 RepID=A0ABP7HJY7_9ACTN|nr:hypothetical protein [Streptomyces coacervatus]MDF2272136.1 hypothetical protein [Streptomyces coacervatus]